MNEREVLNYLHRDVLPLWEIQPNIPLTAKDWEACYLHRITPEEKKENEKVLESLRKSFRSDAKAFDSFLSNEKILMIEHYMGRELFHNYQKEVCRFIQKSRQFDPSLSIAELWQALRNYLIYGMICAMIGTKQDAHDAIMGYSLLYPYTDNTIDDPKKPQDEKDAFNQTIYEHLHGQYGNTKDHTSLQVSNCLDLCLAYRNGMQKKETAAILQVILDAQAKSTHYMGLTNRDIEEQKEQLFETLAYKGGSSVLIDYYFSTLQMKTEEIPFFLQFGMILQFADDIQDLQEDLANGAPTHYTTAKDIKEREARFFQLLHFVKQVFIQYEAVNESVKQFMLRNCQVMLVFAMLRSQQFFSPELLIELEPYVPFTYTYLAKLKKEAGRLDALNLSEQQNLLHQIDVYCEKILLDEI